MKFFIYSACSVTSLFSFLHCHHLWHLSHDLHIVTQLLLVFLLSISHSPFPFIPTMHHCISPVFATASTLHFIPLCYHSLWQSRQTFVHIQYFLAVLWSYSCSLCSSKHTLLEHTMKTQVNRLIQLLCTYPATISHTLMNAWVFLCAAGKNVRLLYTSNALPDDGSLRPKSWS